MATACSAAVVTRFKVTRLRALHAAGGCGLLLDGLEQLLALAGLQPTLLDACDTSDT